MIPKHLILVRDCDDAVADAEAVMGHWSGPSRPRIESLTVAEVLESPDRLGSGAIVWIILNRVDAADLYELIGQIADLHLPAMLTRRDGSNPAGAVHEDGVVACPSGTDPAITCGMLQALLTQAPVCQALVSERNVLRAHQDGLSEQIQKLDEELRLAAQFQREFLPQELPQIGSVQFNALWRPAGYVSGDIYDVVCLDEDHVGFFIADAVGHGVSAALLMVYIKRSLKTKTIDPDDPRGYRITEPSEALACLNRDMIERQTGKVRFATACYGVLNCKTCELRFARAGHPYPMLFRASGQTEMLEPEGGLLGVFPEEMFEQVSLALGVGDRLLLYSDGFELAFPDERTSPTAGHDSRGKARSRANNQYAQEFERFHHGSIESSLVELQQKLNTQAGSLNQQDDLTVLILSVMDEQESAGTEPATVATTAVR